jgi:hypothetical protein
MVKRMKEMPERCRENFQWDKIRVYCSLSKGHTGKHESGLVEWETK